MDPLAFAEPQPIDRVEALEASAKAEWAGELAGHPSDPDLAFAFSRFWAAIGFIRKYKPYGTKFAAPFGYSIFDLRDGEGFSVQLHRTAKVEAFHILGVKETAFVLMASVPEWERHRDEFAELWRRGEPEGSALAIRPEPGDIFRVEELEVVHSIVGCVLEEFATTSNDAVERLYDQNEGRAVEIPPRQASLEDVLASCPWTEPAEPGHVVDLPGRGLRGRHLPVGPDRPVTLEVPAGVVATVACVAGAVELGLRGGDLRLGLAGTAPLAPGETATVGAEMPSHVTVCEVAEGLAFGDFR